MKLAASILALAPSLCGATTLAPGLYQYGETIHNAGSGQGGNTRKSECLTAEDIASGVGIIATRRSCKVENKVATGAELSFTMDCGGTVERVSGRIGSEGFVFTTIVVNATKNGIAAREIRGSRVGTCP